MFSSEAEKMLDTTAEHLGRTMEDDKEAAMAIISNVNFKQFLFKCRAKYEVYNVSLNCI